MFRLDPLRLPDRITAPDPAADGGSREIALSRDGVELRRSIRRVGMRVRIPFAEYHGIAVRVLAPAGQEPGIYLTLDHRDDSLSVMLGVFEDSADAAISARQWSRYAALPVLISDLDGRLRSPAAMRGKAGTHPRRKRRSGLRGRRTSIRARSDRANARLRQNVHAGEREIIARN